MPQIRFRPVRPKLDTAVCTDPKLAVGAVNDRKRIRDEAEEIVFYGELRFEQSKHLTHQRCRPLILDWIACDGFQDLSAHPLIGNDSPHPSVIVPEPTLDVEDQMLASTEVLLERGLH